MNWESSSVNKHAHYLATERLGRPLDVEESTLLAEYTKSLSIAVNAVIEGEDQQVADRAGEVRLRIMASHPDLASCLNDEVHISNFYCLGKEGSVAFKWNGNRFVKTSDYLTAAAE